MQTASVERSDEQIADAWRWLSTELRGRPVPPVIAFIGIGDGHVLDALQQYAPATRVLAIEPDATAGRTFLDSLRARQWSASGRLAYLVGPDYAGADEAWRLFTGAPASPPVLLYPGLTLTPEVGRAAQVLKKILVGVAANDVARRKFAPRYLANSLRNLPAIVAGSDLRHLTDAYRGVPAIVAAAGPSLDAALHDLPGMRDRGLLIACDTALRPMLAASVAPHLVVGVDPSELNARHFLSLPECTDTWLVSESALDRRATEPFDARMFWFRVSNHEPWSWLNELGLDVGQIDVWGSVLTAAFQVACLAGCDPIVVVGADLAFTDGRPYARGTTYEFDWAASAAAGVALDDAWHQQVAAKSLTSAPDLRGGQTTTTPSLVSFRDWLVARAARSGRRVVNASGAGIFAGGGIEQGTLVDALSKTVDLPPVSRFARRHAGVRPTRLAAQVREAHAIVAGGKSSHPLFVRWKEFSGDGFDGEAVAEALDDAVRALETRGRHAGTDPQIARGRIAALIGGASVLAQLPEDIARLRAGMSGVALAASAEAELSTEQRQAILAGAWRLFEAITNELSGLDDLQLTVSTYSIRVPASAAYVWPEPLLWSVQAFEALLGRAWKHQPLDAIHAFFSAPVMARDRAGRTADGAPTGQSTVSRAQLRLACEWLACRASIETDQDIRTSLLRLADLESAVEAAHDVGVADTASFVLHAGDIFASEPITIPLSIDETALGRASTGALSESRGSIDDVPIVSRLHVETSDVKASLVVGASDVHRASLAPSAKRMCHPRVLGDTGDRWSVAYATEAGVVCLRTNDTSSVLVRADGTMETCHRWPRPILFELPFGDGVVAWASGRAMKPVAAPYVMYRRGNDDTPVIDDLPFVPTWGVRWNDRLYWNYLSSNGQQGRGLGSWAPGEGARIDWAADVALFGLHPDGDGLLLDPATRREDFSYERRRLSTGWRWNAVGQLESRPLDANGAVGSRVVHGQWTTTTFPEADLVRFEHRDGRCLSMTVYYPFQALWAGRSLVVGTVDYRLLMFENLLEKLERQDAQ